MADLTQFGQLGPAVDSEASDGTVPPSDPIELQEHESTDPFEISSEDAEFLDRVTADGSAPFEVTYTSDGHVRIHTGSNVGVLTLPSGTQVEVTPKASVTSLLWTLQYAFDTPVDSMGYKTKFSTDSSFFDAIGVLFWNELTTVLDQGLHRDYVRTQAVEDHVRGQIDVQRQLQRPGPQPTDFAVEYDEFTTDTILNRAVLSATRALVRLVRDPTLTGRLRHEEQRLRQFTSVRPVSLEAVNRIELSRLNEHYEMLLDLTRTVLSREFFEDITAGENRALALFVDMNDVYERIVERACRAAASELGELDVEGQDSIPTVVEGPHARSMRPDVVVRGPDEEAVAVLDAKWKPGVSASDVYQLTSYIFALETDGALVYHGGYEHDGEESVVDGEYSLRSVALNTNPSVDSYGDYVDALERSARGYLSSVIRE